jgi:phosphoribosylformimino-5-aminoimidazole carboxamide ribotide isomerase
VIPSIDILNGRCVQLVNGRIETAKDFGTPEEWYNRWVKQGADIIHVIDLDATFSLGSNREIIYELLACNEAEIQVGGGIRNIEYGCELVKRGAKRVIIGSRALDRDFLKQLTKKISKKQIMVALDQKSGTILAEGWQKNTKISFSEGVKSVRLYVGSILTTDVIKEGLMKGVDNEMLKKIVQNDIPTYVSGGFTTKRDISFAKDIGFSGVIIGQALYTKKLTLKELR